MRTDIHTQLAILSKAVRELTKGFEPQQMSEFSKSCFVSVVQGKYEREIQYPIMNIAITKQ